MNREVVVVDAVRSPFGRRGGALASTHSADLLGHVFGALVARTGVAPDLVDQVLVGCVGQVGMQTMNVGRTAWLTAGLPVSVPATTLDSQCGSSQQAATLAVGLIASGLAEVVVAGGVEVMSRVKMGSSVPIEREVGFPVSEAYPFEPTTQFEGAERIADKWGITRSDCDEFGKQSQDRAASAWASDAFESQIAPIDLDPPGSGTDPFSRDEALRETTLDALSQLNPTGRPDGVHTAGTSSQIADGAAALLLMSRERADALGLRALATVVDSCLVGADPVLMLTGPIPATRTLLERNDLELHDVDLIEINEAFASVVLAWTRELDADLEKVNPNGGAIALGHPLGATGAALITKAVHELHRSDGDLALVTMCCGGGLGTGTLIRRA